MCWDEARRPSVCIARFSSYGWVNRSTLRVHIFLRDSRYRSLSVRRDYNPRCRGWECSALVTRLIVLPAHTKGSQILKLSITLSESGSQFLQSQYYTDGYFLVADIYYVLLSGVFLLKIFILWTDVLIPGRLSEAGTPHPGSVYTHCFSHSWGSEAEVTTIIDPPAQIRSHTSSTRTEGVCVLHSRWIHLGPVSQKILSPLVILSMEKTMVTMVISELKSISRLKIFRETEPWISHCVMSHKKTLAWKRRICQWW